MAKHILAMLFFCLCLCGCAAQDNESYYPADSDLMARVANWQAREAQCQNIDYQSGVYDEELIQDMVDEVRFLIEYSTDANNYWQTTDETLCLKSGDCEDMASLAHRLCREARIDDKYIFMGIFKQDGDPIAHVNLCVTPTGNIGEFYAVYLSSTTSYEIKAGYNLRGFWHY